MRRKLLTIISLVIFTFQISLYSKKKPDLPPKYKKWIEEEVVYIVTPKEREVFYKLETDAQRDRFIEEFWRQRDPTPGTSQNEFKEEHYRRIEYANKWFGKGTPIPGWKTERGRVYIILGEPIYRQKFHNSHYIYPIELWFYQGDVSKGLPPFFYIVFFKKFGIGDFELYSPLRDGPKSLLPTTSHELWDPTGAAESFEAYQRRMMGATDDTMGGAAYRIIKERVSIDLAQASLSLIPGGTVNNPIESEKLLGNVNTYPQKKVDDRYAYEFLKYKAVVEVNYSVYYIRNKNLIKTYCDESGVFFIHYVVQPEVLSVDVYRDKYYSNIKISVRVTDLKGKTIFQYNKLYPIEFTKNEIKSVKLRPMNIEDNFPLIPGNYKVNLLLENTVSKEFTSFEREITIPEPLKIPQMSSLLLAYRISKDQEPLRKTFKMANIRVYPSIDNKFHTGETLYVYFQLYNIEGLIEQGRIKYTIFRGKKKVYTRTKRIIDYQSQQNFIEEFPLSRFKPGRYTIKVSVLNENKKEILSEREDFTIKEKPFPKAWIYSKKSPSSADAIYPYLLGTQLLNKGEIEKAYQKLKEAYERNSQSLDFALAYSQVLFLKEEYKKIKEILTPFLKRPIKNYKLYTILGRALQRLEEYKQAISYYQKFISHEGANYQILNSIAECYYALGNYEEALRAWEKSLEINPTQEEIHKKIENLKKKIKNEKNTSNINSNLLV
jgi:GWxTD domain-containing protein